MKRINNFQIPMFCFEPFVMALAAVMPAATWPYLPDRKLFQTLMLMCTLPNRFRIGLKAAFRTANLNQFLRL
jgi:hypothetical protein